MVSSGYHIVTGMALLFWSAISQPSSVSFVRVSKMLKMDIDLAPIVALRPLCIHFCRGTFSATLCFPRTSITCLFFSFNAGIPLLYIFYFKLSRCILPQLLTVLFLNPPNFISSPYSLSTHPLPPPSLHIPQRSPQQSCPTFHIPLR